MSIRDIIEAARGYSIKAEVESSTTGDTEGDNALLRFIATFDPEHVDLMEAERVAARELITDRASGVGFAVRKYDEWVDACEATDRYRKERGL